MALTRSIRISLPRHTRNLLTSHGRASSATVRHMQHRNYAIGHMHMRSSDPGHLPSTTVWEHCLVTGGTTLCRTVDLLYVLRVVYRTSSRARRIRNLPTVDNDLEDLGQN